MALPALPLLGVQWRPDSAEGLRLLSGIVLLVLALWRLRRSPDITALPANSVWFWALLAIAPAAAYLAQFSLAAYRSLFVGDYDFTSLSEAINRTAAGDGLLPSVYLATGKGQSYLGHHFAPILLGYLPIYWIARLGENCTHLLYAVALWLSFLSGLWLWHRLATRLLGNASVAAIFVSALAASWLLLRQSVSFHFEILTLPLAGLLFLALQGLRQAESQNLSKNEERRWRVVYWAALIALLAVKEDLGVYLSFFGLYLLSNNRSGLRAAEAMATIALSAGWHLAASQLVMPWFRGGTELHWAGYWDHSIWGEERRFLPAALAVFGFGIAPLFALRLLLLTVAPIAVLHALSYQPWHNQLFGHYSYGLLPFLAYAALLGLENFRDYESIFRRGLLAASTVATAAFVLIVGAADPYSPLAAPATAAQYRAVQKIMRTLPAEACLQTQFHLSAHAPLALRLYPLSVPIDNPAYAITPGRDAIRRRAAAPPPECRRHFVLLDPTRPMPPYYDAAALQEWLEFSRRELHPVATQDGLLLFEWPTAERPGPATTRK